jgi:outer membrane biosynthesis protein TonB
LIPTLVNADGGAGNIKIVRTPSPGLAGAAIRKVRNWRFKPAHNFQGEAVPMVVDLAVSFRLNVFAAPDRATA